FPTRRSSDLGLAHRGPFPPLDPHPVSVCSPRSRESHQCKYTRVATAQSSRDLLHDHVRPDPAPVPRRVAPTRRPARNARLRRPPKCAAPPVPPPHPPRSPSPHPVKG